MRRIISISETLEMPDTAEHVIANAEAFYDESREEMEVHLKIVPMKDQTIRFPGFTPQIIKTKISLEETIPAAKEVFRSWVKRLLQTGHAAVAK